MLRRDDLDACRRSAGDNIHNPHTVYGEFEYPFRFEVTPELIIVNLLEPPDRIGRGDKRRQRGRHGTCVSKNRTPYQLSALVGSVHAPLRAGLPFPCDAQVLIPDGNQMTTKAHSRNHLAPIVPPPPSPAPDTAFEVWKDQYHRQMGELSRQGMARKAENGILPCCAPVGYRNYRKKIEIDPVLAPLVRASFERPAASGLPLRALLAEMTAKGLVSRSGKPLKVSAFWYMLHNPFYTGMINWKGGLIQGVHEPLITLDLWNNVQSRLSPPT